MDILKVNLETAPKYWQIYNIPNSIFFEGHEANLMTKKSGMLNQISLVIRLCNAIVLQGIISNHYPISDIDLPTVLRCTVVDQFQLLKKEQKNWRDKVYGYLTFSNYSMYRFHQLWLTWIYKLQVIIEFWNSYWFYLSQQVLYWLS